MIPMRQLVQHYNNFLAEYNIDRDRNMDNNYAVRDNKDLHILLNMADNMARKFLGNMVVDTNSAPL